MIVITVARKPLEGSVAKNILKHGTGALNIDASRIGTDVVRVKNYTSRGKGGCMATYYTSHVGETYDTRESTGRWPANLILEHLPECRAVGTKKVKGIMGGLHPVRQSGVHAEAGGHQTVGRAQTPRKGHTDLDGTETIPAWECAPGCPVADLDAQAGPVHARGNTSATVHGGVGEVYGKYGPIVRDEGHWRESGYGFVSRFFKQFQVAPADMALSVFHFHEEEIEDARLSLESSGVTCTARWGDELDKYGKGEVVITPWDLEVCIFGIDRKESIDQHPHKELITERVRRGIGDGPFELLYLHAEVVKSS